MTRHKWRAIREQALAGAWWACPYCGTIHRFHGPSPTAEKPKPRWMNEYSHDGGLTWIRSAKVPPCRERPRRRELFPSYEPVGEDQEP